MKLFHGFLLFLATTSFSFAEEAKLLLHDQALPLLASPEFDKPLDESFKISKGSWIPKEGVLAVLDLPEEKHIPVLHHLVGLSDAVIEVEFFLDGPGSFLVGCDSNKHIGRVVINGKGMSLAEDSVKPSHTIATLPLVVKPGQWHRLRVEWKDDRIAANLDGHELSAQHDFLTTPKSRSWIAAGKSVKIRNLKISGVKGGE